MRRRPMEFIILAFLWITVALSFPLQILFLLEEAPLSFVFSLQAYTPLNLAVMGAALIHAWFVYQASRGMFLSGALFCGVMTWNNWLVASVGNGMSTTVVVISTALGFLVHATLLRNASRRVLIQPNLRWWRSAPRTRIAIQAAVFPVVGGEVLSRTFDLSEGGAFIAMPSDPYKRVVPGTHCSVRLRLDQLRVLNCSAQVVRKTQASGQYPGGFAVRFLNLTQKERKALKNFLSEVGSSPLASAAAA